MNLDRPYSHPPVVVIEGGQRECLRCTRPLAPVGAGLRHADELNPPMKLAPGEAAVVRVAMEVVERALADMVTDRCSDADRAHVTVEALLRRGLIAVRPRRRRSSRAA